MKNKSEIKFRTWLFILFLLNLAYLTYELAFNSRLVDVAVSALTDLEIYSFELEGRFLSGVGLSLLLIRLIKIRNNKFKNILTRVFIAIAIGFPFMFFGQKILVDEMVNRTTAEQRLDAQYLVLMKRGLANNAIQLEGIKFSENDLDSAHTRSFLSVLGLLTYFSPEFIDSLKGQADAVVNQVTTSEANRDLPEAYAEYQALQKKMNEIWSDYSRISDEYWLAKSRIKGKADATWDEIQQKLMTNWTKISSKQNDSENTRNILAIQRSLENYFSARERCESSRFRDECIIRLDEIYRLEIVESLGRYVPPREWCHDPTVISTNVQRHGRFVTEQRQEQQCRNLSFDHVAKKLSSFTDNATTYEQFLVSEEVNRRVRSFLQEKGIEMPINWKANNYTMFREEFINSASNELDDEFNRLIEASFGVALSLDLNADEFVSSPPIQSRLHEALNPLDTDILIKLDLSPVEFRDAIIKPHYLAYANNERKRLFGDVNELANGGAREEEGKRFVRALIVPPIAMGFSLFFALVNAIGLLSSLPSLLNLQQRWLSPVIKIAGMASIITIPMINSAAVVETKTYTYFKNEAGNSLTPLGSFFTTWVINTMPSVYPVGAIAGQIAPPLFPPKPEIEVERSNSAKSVDRNELPTSLKVENNDLLDDQQDTMPHVSKNKNQQAKVAHLDSKNPLGPQLNLLSNKDIKRVMIDAQQLRDYTWVVHRDPVISGQGTCLTNFQRSVQLSHVDGLQWRSARHGSCGINELSKQAIPIPTLKNFISLYSRYDSYQQMWVHFQPTLLGEVNCNSLRNTADSLNNELNGKLVVAASNQYVLSCFDRHPREYALAYFGPLYGEPNSDNQTSVRHLNREEVRRLRDRARGVGYRDYSRSLALSKLESLTAQLSPGDYFIIHQKHLTPVIADYISNTRIRLGQYGGNDTKKETITNNSIELKVTREF